MEPLLEKQSEHLKTLMEMRGVSAEDLAAICDVSRVTIQDYVRGKRPFRCDVLCAIADYFDVTADYLLGRVEDMGEGCDIEEPEVEYEVTPSVHNSSNVALPKEKPPAIKVRVTRPAALDDVMGYMKKDASMTHTVLSWAKSNAIRHPKNHQAVLRFAEESLYELEDTVSYRDAANEKGEKEYKKLLEYQMGKVIRLRQAGIYGSMDTARILRVYDEARMA